MRIEARQAVDDLPITVGGEGNFIVVADPAKKTRKYTLSGIHSTML